MSTRPADALPTADCPSDERIARHLAAPSLTPDGERIIAHTEGCDRCRARVGEALRAQQAATAPGAPESTSGRPALRPGLAFGEYELGEPIGAGATAQVYLARHPSLDRQVALKLVALPETPSAREHTAARALREGRALAKLTHPNVVTVHTVGEAHGYAYVAMELVRGGTLRAMASRPPASAAEVRARLATLVLAGRGLAAAHRSGLVHRDFKPDNVLLTETGVPRVTDFGLAREAEGSQETSFDTVSGEFEDAATRLTRSGAVVGTPAYMAPEQLEGHPATALSDQFAFCVTASECLLGARPFEAPPAGSRRFARGPLRPFPRQSVVPRAVVRLLWRGLEPAPAARHPSLESLLDALEREARPPRRWRWAALPVGLAVLVATAVTWSQHQAKVRAERCADAARWTGVWDAARKAERSGAFAATGKPFAAAAAMQVIASIDRFTQSWSDLERQRCLSPEADGRGDRAYETLCLSQRRHDLVALIDALCRPTPEGVGRVSDLSATVAPASSCLVAPSPTARPPLEETASKERDAVQDLIARSRVNRQVGDLADAERQGREALSQARALAQAPLEAEAGLALGWALRDLEKREEATTVLFAAVMLAEKTGLFALAAQVWLTMATIDRSGTQVASERWLELADVAIARAGSPWELEAQAMSERGYSLVLHGRFDGAIALQEKATAVLTRHLGAESPTALKSTGRLASSLGMMGRCTEAEPLLRQNLARRRVALSPLHPETLQILETLAICLQRTGRAEESLPLFDELLRGRAQLSGPESPPYAVALSNYAGALHDLHRFPEALELVERAWAIKVKAFGPTDPRVARQLMDVGIVLRSMGRSAEALESLHRARDLFEQSPGDGPFQGAEVRLEAAGVLAVLKRWEPLLEELEPLERLPDAQAKLLGGSAAELRARALLGLGRTAAAEKQLVRAVAMPLSDVYRAADRDRAQAALDGLRARPPRGP